MAELPFRQDVRASLTLLVSDDILENNRVIDPGNPPDVPTTYAEWDDSLENVHFSTHRAKGRLYFYVPAGTRSVEGKLVDRTYVEDFLKGKRVVILCSFNQAHLADGVWTYDSNMTHERVQVRDFDPTWHGYNMVSQWYWLSDEAMLGEPEYVECACWSIPMP